MKKLIKLLAALAAAYCVYEADKKRIDDWIAKGVVKA